MSNPTYDLETITRYLLGSLPEAEIERLDELSITDDEFVDTLRSAEKDLVDAYAQGELSSASRDRFESYYLTSPLRRERVKFAQAFQEYGTKAEVAQAIGGQRKDEREQSARREDSGWLSSLVVFLSPRQWGLAAIVLIFLFTGGFLLFQNMRLRQQMNQTQARRDELGRREQELQKAIAAERAVNSKTEEELAQVRAERERLDQELKQQRGSLPTNQSPDSIASLVLTPQLRGAGQTPTLSITGATRSVAAQLHLEPNDFTVYRVALFDQSDQQKLWASGKLSAKAKGESKSLSINFPAGLLRAQTYTLQVYGVSPNGASQTISDYPFRVVK